MVQVARRETTLRSRFLHSDSRPAALEVLEHPAAMALVRDSTLALAHAGRSEASAHGPVIGRANQGCAHRAAALETEHTRFVTVSWDPARHPALHHDDEGGP
jgi:hypothetical protein